MVFLDFYLFKLGFLLNLEFKWAFELRLLLGSSTIELLWVIERFYLLAEVELDRFLGFFVNIDDW